MSLTLRLHEMAGDTSTEEAGLMKQQSRVEAAGRIRLTRSTQDRDGGLRKSPEIAGALKASFYRSAPHQAG